MTYEVYIVAAAKHAKHGKQLTEPDAFPTDQAALEEAEDDLAA